MIRRPCWWRNNRKKVAQVLYYNRVKFSKDFFAIVLSTNMAAMTSVQSKNLLRHDKFHPQLSFVHLLRDISRTRKRPGTRFSKVTKTFRARKAICEPVNRLFRKADLLKCFQGNKKQTNCEVRELKFSPFLRYKRNCDTRKWPVRFRDFRETGPSS